MKFLFILCAICGLALAFRQLTESRKLIVHRNPIDNNILNFSSSVRNNSDFDAILSSAEFEPVKGSESERAQAEANVQQSFFINLGRGTTGTRKVIYHQFKCSEIGKDFNNLQV